MEATAVINESFWMDGATRVLAGPLVPRDNQEAACQAAEGHPEVKGRLLVATSGSTGAPRFAVLSREAILTSARAVNAHLEVGEGDRWGLVLPAYHVGGLGVVARARAAGLDCAVGASPWQAGEFAEWLREQGVTLSSLVPTQVHDLVAGGQVAPAGLRAVLVGGGALKTSLREKATALGWPLLETYGCTEAASQIATEPLDRAGKGSTKAPGSSGSERLRMLPIWEAALEENKGTLRFRGSARFEGYFEAPSESPPKVGSWYLRRPFDDEGWFTTQDRVTLDGSWLRFEGRRDRRVKVLGELVNLDELDAALATLSDVGSTVGEVAVVPVPDERRGHRLVAAFERKASDSGCGQGAWEKAIEAILSKWNLAHVGPERLSAWVGLEAFPRGALGKVQQGDLVNAVAEAEFRELPLPPSGPSS